MSCCGSAHLEAAVAIGIESNGNAVVGIDGAIDCEHASFGIEVVR